MSESMDRRDVNKHPLDEPGLHEGTDADADGLLGRDAKEGLRLGDAGRSLDDTTDASESRSGSW